MMPLSLPVQKLTPAAFAPYGTVWGHSPAKDTLAFTNPATDFWHEHFFEPGENGKPEVLWVNYRKNDGIIDTLEAHWLTEQAIVPLGSNSIIHVVALCDETGTRPNLATLRAFEVPAGQGVCMRPGCWHATQVLGQQVSCLMLTRGSTTVELVEHLQQGTSARETSLLSLSKTFALSL